jgi:cytochrome c biogenesis protein CcdA
LIENISNIANELMQSTRFPLLIALLLGLLVSLNPCQLAINVSALTYLHKNTKLKNKGFLTGIIYTIGRSLTYIVLGWALTILIKQGNNIEIVRKLLSKSEIVLPYVLLAIGLFLIIRAVASHKHHHGDNCHNSGYLINRKGTAGPLILGSILALAFCPESAIFYFAMLIPLSASTVYGWAMPIIFAVSAAIPIIILSWLISTAMHSLKKTERIFAHVQQTANIITGIIFIIIGITFLI